MNAFPEDYVAHNLPLILLSGLGTGDGSSNEPSTRSQERLLEGGFRLKTQIPPITGETADKLLEAFLKVDSSNAPWNSRYNSKGGGGGSLKIRRVGRVDISTLKGLKHDLLTAKQTYTLPPRKAPPPPHSPRHTPLSDADSPPPPLILHSTISPLTPSSPIYPDGILTPLWVTKHQHRIPAVLLLFFMLEADPDTNSLHDNQLKTEISSFRGTLVSTNYKTKVVVVLVGSRSDEAPSDLDDRLGSIRRATGTDAKTLLFLSASSSSAQVKDFVQSVLSSMHAFCIEYYRDLSKHVRRKRSRNNVPPPTIPPSSGTSQTLPLQGWNVRYEFKLGVLAEFRQEMDAAGRNYEGAYETLFDQELLEAIPAWSPRFNEARLLADALAIRIIRCRLWNGQTTGAVRSWLNHHDRIQQLIDRRGKGTSNYGWEAWESTWSKTMAQLVERSELTAFSFSEPLDPQLRKAALIFAQPEKAIPLGERIPPWELLHHEGYWLQKSWQHTARRRTLALQIPEEDRASPGRSPASVIANKSHLYDTYLTLEAHAEYPIRDQPGFDYSKEITSTLQLALGHLSKRSQLRAMAHLELEKAHEYMRAEAWEDAMSVLRSIWSQRLWRDAGWWSHMLQVGVALRACAVRIKDAETLVRLEWELENKVFDIHSGIEPSLQEILQNSVAAKAKPNVVIRAEDSLSSINPGIVFAAADGNVGEPLKAQLVIQSMRRQGTEPIRLSEVKVVFEGGLRPVRLLPDEQSSPFQSGVENRLYNVVLHDSRPVTDSSTPRSSVSALMALVGQTDLCFKAGQLKAYDLTLIPREAGELKIASISVMLDNEQFSLDYVVSEQNHAPSLWWTQKHGRTVYRRRGRERDLGSVRILPKPPRVQLLTPDLEKVYYTNEEPIIRIDVVNEEDEAAVVSIQARLISPQHHSMNMRWDDMDDSLPNELLQEAEGSLVLPSNSIGSISRSDSHTLRIMMTDTIDPLDHELELVARYHLESDPETPLVKTHTVDLVFIRPLESNYEFLPLLDSRPWPNFFEVPQLPEPVSEMDDANAMEKVSSIMTGLSQKYALTASVFSFASESLAIESFDLLIQSVSGGAVCHTSKLQRQKMLRTGAEVVEAHATSTLKPEETRELEFVIDLQKESFANRLTVSVDLALDVRWRRSNKGPDSVVTSSTLEIPRFVIPMSEPRVLITASPSSVSPAMSGLKHLRFIIENPSMHFLTFNVTMDSSEDFAFSGPKMTSVSLVPLSRHDLEYRILSTKVKEWVRVSLGVVDAYFGKTLKVNAAGEGVKSEVKKMQNLVYVWID